MNRLGLITSLGAALALPACIVDHGLGETAEGSDDSDGSGSGTESSPDPGPISGQPPTTATSTTSASATSGETDGDSGGTDDESSGTDTGTDTEGELGCGPEQEFVRWVHNGLGNSPLAGIDASFAAILTGECLVVDGEGGGTLDEQTVEWDLQCSLSGRIDGDAMVSDDFTVTFEITGSAFAVAAIADTFILLDSWEEPVRLSVVLDWWGMGWNSWLVIEDQAGMPLLDLVDAEYVDPTSSTWSMEVDQMLGGAPWHKGMAVGTTAAECGGPITECNDEPMAITVGWIEESPLVLHPYQEGTIDTPFPGQQMRVSVTSAHATPMPTCTDMPLASYAMAAWAVTP